MRIVSGNQASRREDLLLVEEELRHTRVVLVRYVRARIAAPDDVDDVVQDVLVAAAGTPRPTGVGLIPFALGIARHKTADWWRRQRSDRHDFTATVPDHLELVDGPESVHAGRDRARLAARLLQQLPRRDAELLLLRMSGATAEETGAVLELSAGAVRVAQHRALAKLRALPEAQVLDDA